MRGWTTYICVYLGSALLALLITPVVIWLARRVKAVDRPGVRTVHERPIPRIGGIAIFLSSMTLIVAVLFLNNNVGEAFRRTRLEVTTLLCAATFIFLIGLVDDLKGLPARFKFLAETVGTVALCCAGVRITDIAVTDQWVLALGGFGCVLTLLWVVGVTNAVNFSDGLDGLAAGISTVACGVIAIFAIHSGDVVMAVFMLALVGSLSGFLFFNFNPARVFMGDCGSLFLGFTIAATSVLCVAKSAALVGLALPALALGVPIFDTLSSMLRRFLERRSMFAPDRSHFHHRLLELGLHQRHAVIAVYLVTLLAAGLGLFMLVSEDVGSLVIFGCLLVLIVLLFRVVGAVRLHETTARLRTKHAFTLRQRQDRQAFEHLQLRFRGACDRAEWWRAVCEAAERMEFAWLSLKTFHADGRVDEEIWELPERKPDLAKVVTMTIPCGNGDPRIRRQFEIAIAVNGSLEAASRRATLFGRLIDENALPPPERGALVCG